MAAVAKRRAVAFILLVAAVSVLADQLISRGLFGNAGSLAYMWCPALAAIIASAITRRSLKEIGWLPRFKWSGLAWLTGLGTVPKSTFLERARMTLHLSAAQPNWLVILTAFGFIAVPLLLPSM